MEASAFYDLHAGLGFELRRILAPLDCLTPQERAVFVEYFYWKSHMRVVAGSYRISVSRAYAVLYKAEEKVAARMAN